MIQTKYIFDLSSMIKKMRTYSAALDKYNAAFVFPVKAFPHPRVLKPAISILKNIEISNPTELAQLPPTKKLNSLWLNDPLQSQPANYLNKIKATNYFVVFGPHNIELAKNNTETTMALRFNLNHLSSSSQHSRFGFSFNNWQKFISLSEIKKVQCFSFHLPLQKFQEATYLHYASELSQLQKKLKLNIMHVNFGGSFPNISIEKTARLLKALRKHLGNECQFYFEPGRFWSQEFGQIECQITNYKTWKQQKQIQLNVSKECHLKWSPYQLPKAVDNKSTIPVYGSTCAESDYLGNTSAPKSLKQKFIIRNINGYSWAWQKSFNGIPEMDIEFI